MSESPDTLRRAASRARRDSDPRWHPVGEWLAAEARAYENDESIWQAHYTPALAVARALLGEDESR